jgi:hypothetical protein
MRARGLPPNPLGLPICKECGRLMAITRVEPGIADDGPELQTFECPECQSTVQRSVPRRCAMDNSPSAPAPRR